jgi:hypothetical protein
MESLPSSRDSILTSIKKKLGMEEEDINFDDEVIIEINTAFVDLNRLGVGPVEGFTISDKTTLWTDYIGTDKRLENVKTYIYLQAKLVFDPPTTSFLVDAINRKIEKLEWCINNYVDKPAPVIVVEEEVF